jgi:hypothetical protein
LFSANSESWRGTGLQYQFINFHPGDFYDLVIGETSEIGNERFDHKQPILTEPHGDIAKAPDLLFLAVQSEKSIERDKDRIDQVEPCRAKVPDRLPDMNWNRDHYTLITGVELRPLQLQIDVVIIKAS